MSGNDTLQIVANFAAIGFVLLVAISGFLLLTSAGERWLENIWARILLWASSSLLFVLFFALSGLFLELLLRSDDAGIEKFLGRSESTEFILAWSSFWMPVLVCHVLFTQVSWLGSTRFFPTIEQQWKETVPALLLTCFMNFPITVGIVINALEASGVLNWHASTLEYLLNLVLVSLVSSISLLAPRALIRNLHPGAFDRRQEPRIPEGLPPRTT